MALAPSSASFPDNPAFEALARSAMDSIACCTSEGTIVFWNAAAERTFGHTATDMVGRPFTILTTDEYSPAEADRGPIALTALRRDGTQFPVELVLSSWANGSDHYFTAVIRDVSERVVWDELLTATEDDYRRLFEYAHDAILILDPETETVLAANRQACDLYGMTAEEIVGMSLEERSVDVTMGKRRLFETLAHGGGRHSFSTLQSRKDGSVMELEIAAGSVHYQGVDAILSINRDVTARNTAQRALRRERDFVTRVLDVAGSLVIVLDREGRIVRFNKACERASGYTFEEAVGRAVWDFLLLPQEAEEVRAEFGRLAVGQHSSVFENHWRRKDGLLRTIVWSSTTLTDSDGAVEFVVGTGLDVTETRLVEEQLAKTRRLSSLGELAGTVAHEFNNVLMGISPFATILQRRGDADPSIANAAASIIRSVARGKSIAAQILRYAQPAEPVVGRVNVETFLEELRQDLLPQIAPKVSLSAHAAPGLVMAADPLQIHQVLSNLVLNARDAMRGGGHVTIEVFRGTAGHSEFGVIGDPSAFAHFHVTDDGEGMSPETLSRIFEPLFTTKKSGTGLGLAVSYAIVKRHNGYIFVESAPGLGTTFHIYIPILN